MTTNGTGFSEWAVCGPPSGVSISSALPWSAVTIAPPPRSSTALSTWPRQRSAVSTARIAAGMLPVWPTMSGFAKLMTPKRNGRSSSAAARHRSTNAAAAGSALISGFSS